MWQRGAWIAAVVALWSGGAAGQTVDCARADPGICEIMPTPPPRLDECAVEAVPRNAPIKVRLTDGFLDELGLEGVGVWVHHAETGEPVPGDLTDVGHDTVYFTPESPWEAGAQYDAVLQAGLDEMGLCFVASHDFDTEPPRLGPILSITPRSDGSADDLEEGALRIDLEFEAATDDGPLGSLEYFVYLTRGEGLSGALLLWRGRHQADVMVAGLVLPRAYTVAPVCIAILAVDGVGHTDTVGPACFEPLQGNYFEPLCTAVPGAPRGSPIGVGCLVLAALVFRRRWAAERCGEA